MPSIDRNSSEPFYRQVYDQIATGIESGVYPAGEKLPSIRECARELGVSNTTVELAYQKLTEEGYVEARRGSGYTICKVNIRPRSADAAFDRSYADALAQLASEEHANPVAVSDVDSGTASRQDGFAYDFNYDAADAQAFPFATWARICREVFFIQGAQAACLYNDRQGLYELRTEIAHYVEREYGVACRAEQVLVMPTTRDLVAAIVSLFDPSGRAIALENPGYDEVECELHRRGFRTAHVPAAPYPAFEDVGATLDDAALVFSTPASQFPSNRAMPVALRKSLVEWATAHDAYVIDDEYGWEFQSGIDRTPPLASLDRTGKVITIGTFSNSFTPAVCLSYAILPPQLMLKWRRAERGSHPQVPWQTQAAMALFMREGHWRMHVRKVRALMQKKRRTLVDALRVHFGDAFEIIEGPSSLFLLVQARDGRSEGELVEAAARASVRVYPTRRYWSGDVPGDWRYVLVGYAGIPLDDIVPGVRALAQVW